MEPNLQRATKTEVRSKLRLNHSDELPINWMNPELPLHQENMETALREAEVAFQEDEVPVGAAIFSLDSGWVIASAHNQKEQLKDPTAHAEMIAITQAAAALKSWRLLNCILYVTLEPCPMCAGALLQARIPCVVYGAADPKAGACQSLFQLTSDSRLNHQALVIPGVLAEQSAAILSRFFAQKRALGKK